MSPILTNHTAAADKNRQPAVHKTDITGKEADKPQRIRFLDLKELAPGTRTTTRKIFRQRHDAKLSERMFTHVPILIEKIVPYRDHLNSTDIR
ncbi:atp-dependent rna helicase [Musa troglodytarum]|uniref:Atp-dependent rna helicase n=1 Tax=Musa troglodytarum TaxID=320322 RepID=A0A9E7K889_9LILI|nr:atp-dependent rna helicase [Musa troglodytarum]